jgi:hypothetical protein
MPVGIKNDRQQIVKIFAEIFHNHPNCMRVIYSLWSNAGHTPMASINLLLKTVNFNR